MKIRSYSYPSGSKLWRYSYPFKYLNRHGWDARTVEENIKDEDLLGVDIVCLKSVVDKDAIATVLAHRYLRRNRLKVVVDVDDALFTEETNPYFKMWKETDAEFTIKQTIKAADLVTVTTEHLAEQVRSLNKKVMVVPNMYDPEWMIVPRWENTDGTVRIGWAGSMTHIKDLEMIAPAINRIMDKYLSVRFVVCGDIRMKNLIKYPERMEVYQPTEMAMYPMRLASMYMDIGIAPLVDDEFNRCKSPIKAIEYSVLEIPSICSPTVYGDLPYVKIAKNIDEWVDKLSVLIEDKELRIKRGKQACAYVTEHDNLKTHIDKWIKAYESLK